MAIQSKIKVITNCMNSSNGYQNSYIDHAVTENPGQLQDLSNDLDNHLADPSQKNDRENSGKKRGQDNEPQSIPIFKVDIGLPEEIASSRHHSANKKEEDKFEGLSLDPQDDDPNTNTDHKGVALNKEQACEEDNNEIIPAENGYESKAIHELAQDGIQQSIKQKNLDGIKTAIMGGQEFAGIAKNPLFDYNQEALESFEPEKKHSQLGSRLKKITQYSLLGVFLVKIVWENLKQYDKQKSQELSTKMHNEFNYSMSEQPLKKLMPVHWFLEMNKEDVVDRMECLENKNDTICQLYEEKKCAIQDKKSYQYEYCMLRTYRKYGQEQKKFCIMHYHNSGLYLPSEKSTPDFIESFHSCLERSGTPRGKQYCDDFLGLDPLTKQQDYFDCYEGHDVNIQEYGEALCRFQNPPEEGQSSQDEEENKANCQDDPSFTYDCQNVENMSQFGPYAGYDTYYDPYGYGSDSYYNYYYPQSDDYDIGYGMYGGYYYYSDDGNTYYYSYDGYNYLYETGDIETEAMDGNSYRYEGCENDDSVGDSYYDTCSGWYDKNPGDCGNYDTEDFFAVDLCCVCKGYVGIPIEEEPVPEPEIVEPDSSGQNDGGTLRQLVDNDYPQECAQYYTDYFNSYEACCACGGGIYPEIEKDDPYKQCLVRVGLNATAEKYECDQMENEYDEHEYRYLCWDYDQSQHCEDDLSVSDSGGYTCQAFDWYKAFPSTCGYYDTDDFIATSACCVCGGGTIHTEKVIFGSNPEVSSYCEQTKAIIQNQKQCYINKGQMSNKEYCDAQLHVDPSWTRPEQYFECYNGIGLDTSDTHLCEHLYPINDENIGGSLKLLKCYEAFNITLTPDDIHQKCLSTHQENMAYEINEYSECLKSFGTKRSYDHCWLDFKKVSIQIDKRQFIVEPTHHYTWPSEQSSQTGPAPPWETEMLPWETMEGPPSVRGDPQELEYWDPYIPFSYLYSDLTEFYFQSYWNLRRLSGYGMPEGSYGMVEEPVLDYTSYDFEDCFTKSGSTLKMTAYFCWQKFQSAEANRVKEQDIYELRECFEEYNMPLSPELDCKFKFDPQQNLQYKVKEGLNSSIPKNCLWYNYDRCEIEWTDSACNRNFAYAQDSYTYGHIFEDPETHMARFYGHACELLQPDYTQYNECIENRLNQFNQELNEKLEEISLFDSDINYKRFSNNSEYCDKVFAVSENNKEQTESRYLCYEMINQAVSPLEYCFEIQLVSNKDMYMYNHFYKYLCLLFNQVELDTQAISCLDVNNLFDRLIKKRDDCLRAYEAELMPIKSTDGPLFIFQRPIVFLEPVENLTRVKDKETNFTLSDINDFLCSEKISATFQSSPYKEIKEISSVSKTKKVNEHNFQMKCSVFEYVNITRDNLVVHLSFDDSESFKNQFGQSYYNKNFSNDEMVINRTDSNEQYFNLTFSEDLNLLQILKNSLFHYKSDSTLDFDIKDEDSFTKFKGLSNTTKLLETYSHIISREMIPDQNLMGEQTNLTQKARVATKRLFGIPYEFGPLTNVSIDLSKIYEMIKPLNIKFLVKQEIPRINTFRVNIQMNFVEQVNVIDYFGVLDLISELGGLNASVNTLLASLLGIFLIVFFYSFSSMVKRQNRHEVDHQLVKQNQKVLKEIIEKMKESLEEADANQRAATQKEMEELESLLDGEYLKTYADTEERLHQITQKVKKHRPEAVKDIFQYNAKRNPSQWEEIEHRENTEKRAIYLKRSKLTLTEIVKQIQQRMHFYSIYKMSDHIEANKIKIRKIKYHTRLQRDQIQKQQEQIDQLRAENHELKEQNKKFQQSIEKHDEIFTFIKKMQIETNEMHQGKLKDD